MVRILLSCFLFAFTPAAALSANDAVALKLPSGWTANPALAQRAPIVWARSGAQGDETLSALALPSNGLSPSVAMARIRAKLTPPNTPAWKTEATLCGAPGLVITGRSTTSLPDTEFIVVQSGTTLYLFAYAHALNAGGDAQTERFIRTACPSSASALPSLEPPPGWTAKTLVENIGGWQAQSGDSILLGTTSLAEAARLSSALKSAPTSSGGQTFAACSGTGLQWDQQDSVGSQSFKMTTFVITTHESAYLIYYRHAQAADPSVVAAIRGYCPAGASTVGMR